MSTTTEQKTLGQIANEAYLSPATGRWSLYTKEAKAEWENVATAVIRSFLESNGLTAADCADAAKVAKISAHEFKRWIDFSSQLNGLLFSRLSRLPANPSQVEDDNFLYFAPGETVIQQGDLEASCLTNLVPYSSICFGEKNECRLARPKPTALQAVEKKPKQLFGIWLAAHDQFTCPDCGGHHFGSTLKDRANGFGLITERQCHDEYGKGCHWSGPYYFPSDLASLARYGLDAHTKLTAAEKRIAELEKDLASAKLAIDYWKGHAQAPCEECNRLRSTLAQREQELANEKRNTDQLTKGQSKLRNVINAKIRQYDELKAELSALRQRCGWNEITADPASLPTAADADRNGQVEWLTIKDGEVGTHKWNHEWQNPQSHWRHTNLPPVPKKDVEDDGGLGKAWEEYLESSPAVDNRCHADFEAGYRAAQSAARKEGQVG